MLEHHGSRDTPPLPVVHPLDKARGLVEAQEPRKRGVAASRFDNRFRFFGDHAADGKRSVDRLSNAKLTQAINDAFSIHAAMQSEAEQAFTALLKRLKDRGVPESEFAKSLGLSKQRFHNWRKRGLPANQYKVVADSLRISVDELLGGVREPSRSYTVPILNASEQARAFAAEWQQLNEPLRSQIQTMVESLLAEQKKAERKAKKRRSEDDRASQ